jgi:hypothetical protein
MRVSHRDMGRIGGHAPQHGSTPALAQTEGPQWVGHDRSNRVLADMERLRRCLAADAVAGLVRLRPLRTLLAVDSTNGAVKREVKPRLLEESQRGGRSSFSRRAHGPGYQ